MPELARSFHISDDHFRRLFKRQTGMAPYEYYLELKMYSPGSCSARLRAYPKTEQKATTSVEQDMEVT